jgi:uncharacterized membrane protein YfcA
LTIGFLSGVMSGLLGIGGGAVAVPAMVMLLGISQHRAHGTSLAMIMLTAPAAALAYNRQGYMDWGLALVLTAGMVVGAVIGAKLMMRIPAKRLRRIFAVVLLASAVKLLWG